MDIAKLRSLLAKATPGPWRKFNSEYGNSVIAIMQGDRPGQGTRWPEIISWPGFDSSDMPKGRRLHARRHRMVRLGLSFQPMRPGGNMKPYLVIADLDPPHAPFAVLSVDPTQRVGTGCKAVVVSLHHTREEAERALSHDYRR